jgi:hypothetical protein
MDCRQALSRLADYSADGLDTPDAQELMRHLAHCPECDVEWKAFQQTLFRLSAAAQPLPSAEQSRRIWAACLEEVSRSVEHRREAQRQKPGFFSLAPRWSWAMLGGAAAVFASVWFLAPRAENVTTAPRTAELVTLQTPPSLMAPLVTHHAAFAFDAFNDHTATSLISYGATAPDATAPGPAAPRNLPNAAVSSPTP